jgi:hypothetical protein
MPAIVEPDIPVAQSGAPVPGPERDSSTRAAAGSELLRSAAAVALYSFPALLFIRSFYMVDPDIWWHLRSGQWILEHRAVPLTDPFSSFGAGKPWVAYGWLFDSVLAALYSRWGLASIALYEIAVRVALPVALFHAVRGLLPRFWRAAALTATALYVMTRIIGPRPGMLTILLVIVLFDFLLSAERTGRTRALWLVPPLLAFWANWHIQFVYGLAVLGVFACEWVLNSLLGYAPRRPNLLPPRAVWLALAGGALATLCNPYGVKLYSTVFGLAAQTGVYNEITEFLAMNFREPQHFLALLLVLGAAMALGWRRDARPLWVICLLTASFLAFRSVREIWFLAVVSVCAIADGWQSNADDSRRRAPLRSRLLVGVWVFAALVAACRHYGLSNDALEIQTAGAFPEAAVRFVEQHRLPGPLMNDLSWGGYLLWRLPDHPVALDGRTNIYGDARIQRFSNVWKGKPGWESDPDLAAANLVITPSDAAIASLLRFDPRFQVAYEDVQAVVFSRRP